MSGNFWGDLIRCIREEQGVSQRVLANRAKVGRSALRRLETGEAPGTIDVVERLLHYLGYELEAMKRDEPASILREQARCEIDAKQRSRIAANRLMAI